MIYESIGQNVYFSMNENCERRLLCIAVDSDAADKIKRALNLAQVDMSIDYQFITASLVKQP
jgi:ribosomal protein L16/L10AE